MIRSWFCIILSFFALSHLIGQELLIELEVDMAHELAIISDSHDDGLIEQSGEKLRLLVIECLNTRGCWEYPFDSLTNMNTMYSPDQAFRIFNWNLSWMDRTNSYYCFVLTQDKKTEFYSWTELEPPPNLPSKIEIKYLNSNQWLGCLYYQIIPIKKGKKTVYTMLGWDGKNKLSSRKIIDVMAWQSGEIRLGAPIFKGLKNNPKRFIIEFDSEVKVTMNFRVKEKRIIFDHLAPRNPIMEGIFSTYGPDGSFDAWNLTKGKWVFSENIDARLKKDDKPYKDPREKH